MTEKLENALNNVEMTYQQIKEIADSLVNEYAKEIDTLINYISINAENLTNDDIRVLMLKLSVKAYSFGDIKEKSAIKATCAEALRKEAYATSYTSTEGKLGEKDNKALLAISEEIVAETTYDLVSGLFKVKLDEVRRMVDTLKTVLMSRLSEAKLSNIDIGEK